MGDLNPARSHPFHPTYTDSQLSQYLHSFSFNYQDTFPHGFALDYNQLKIIQQHHLSTYPFDNLSLHYSTTHTISLDADALFEKFVTADRGRGGYCMENNAFFGTMLRTMGYDVTSVGARVCNAINGGDGETFGGWSHMVNIVTIADSKYMVDVGFGGSGATAPLPLQEDDIHERIAPSSEMRLARANIKQCTDASQRLWLYQARDTSEAAWQTQYCFTETEFLPADYAMMNFWTSQSRTSIFTQAILMAKMVMRGGEVVGAVTMFNGKVKRKVGDVVEERCCVAEKDRLEVLREWFGVKLTGEEERGIRGLVTELKGDGGT